MWIKLSPGLLFSFLLVSLPLCSAPAARTEEQRYRITESQLLSIEQLIQELEANRLNWESQAHSLNRSLGQSEKRAETLNGQLREERSRYSELQLSFNRYETSQLKSQAEKDQEITELKVSSKAVKGQRNAAVITAAALGLAWVVLIVYTVCKKLKIIPSNG
jgi:septal ring factor EnvC (AmiA/AmiB activator)